MAGGKPLSLFESGAIMLYLSDKAGGKLLPSDPALKWEALSWLFWQIGGVGPMFGQFGHFHKHAPERVEYGINRYSAEVEGF
ncbi:glutathione S-transferase [Monoraphidium neglectum]|uniref:Glutathione S-transferase n=1 Tax=Monoraphidium neglectum TaxID=145388 RepID=A0A0D2KBE4_9CHLO|nr:glutathione S-transferase [Monoraphidium neglectum]KIY93283.1 glutathione S-transferase [Monoraphidium neglectum]|eukprot:XP_013892303.1 glutathione S-transferase [Monoraphidium neglectum]